MSAWNQLHVQKPEASQLDQRESCHSKPVLESHLDLLREGTFSDVTFIVGPGKERILGHQIFLKARSPIFAVMFSERWNEGSTKEVLLEDVDPRIFKKFLEYIYADTLVDNVSEALELLQLAHMYDVQLLVSKCEKLLESQVTLDEAVDVFQAARKYDKTHLMDKAGDLMAESMPKLRNLPAFSRMDQETLVHMLKRNDLKMKEIDVFHLAVQWAKSQSEFTVEQSLEHILPLVRFPLMTPNEFTTIVVPTGLLSQSELIELFTYFGTDAQTQKSMASTLKFSTARRQPAASAIAIYSRDFDDCPITRETLRRLYDRLEFDFFKLHGPFGMFSTLYSLLAGSPLHQKTKFALSSIRFYCPTTIKTSSWENDSSLEKTFKVVVKDREHYDDNNYKELLVLADVKAQDGKIKHVEFIPEIPLESKKHYAITVEETPHREDYRAYDVRDFGSIRNSVTTAVEENWVCVGNICSKKGYFQTRTPHLIFQLSLREL